MRGFAQGQLGEASPAQLPAASQETITVQHDNLKQISDVVERAVEALSPATVSA